jgi:hypothetical protein
VIVTIIVPQVAAVQEVAMGAAESGMGDVCEYLLPPQALNAVISNAHAPAANHRRGPNAVSAPFKHSMEVSSFW